jgi:hypothetical protein
MECPKFRRLLNAAAAGALGPRNKKSPRRGAK